MIEPVERMLRHIYGHNIEDGATLKNNTRLLMVADEYAVESLVELAESLIADHLKRWTGNLEQATEMLETVYEAPKGDGKLRRLAAVACWDQVQALREGKKFQDLLAKFPDMALNLLQRSVSDD